MLCDVLPVISIHLCAERNVWTPSLKLLHILEISSFMSLSRIYASSASLAIYIYIIFSVCQSNKYTELRCQFRITTSIEWLLFFLLLVFHVWQYIRINQINLNFYSDMFLNFCGWSFSRFVKVKYGKEG